MYAWDVTSVSFSRFEAEEEILEEDNWLFILSPRLLNTAALNIKRLDLD